MSVGKGSSRRRTFVRAALVLAVCVFAGTVVAQGKGKKGGGSSLPADANVAYNTMGGGEIMLLDTVSGEVGTLANDGKDPAWSPDRGQIAYMSNSGWDLVFRNSDGTGAVQYVTTVTERSLSNLDWSRAPTPNGRHMLLYVDRDDPAMLWSIYAIGTDGTGKVELVHADSSGFFAAPRWSPSGGQFLYRSAYSGTLRCTVGLV